MVPPDPDTQLAAYGRVCDSYHNIDDFRMKLLGLLPVATGAGVFFLLNANANAIGSGSGGKAAAAFGAIGAFGFLFTAGLFAYELFGIKRCHYLIEVGRRLEQDLAVRGQFRNRPLALAGFINEPLATSFIYPGSLAAWIFLALVLTNGVVAVCLAVAVLVAGCAATFKGVRRMAENHDLEQRLIEQPAGPDAADFLGVSPARARGVVERVQKRNV